ncbi:flagellar basal-body rod protein FlgC [Desulfonatronum thiosulfatophilum]|uniref:Flagellar basal-body rod protein FlgC n=1 Tax=Desulfonatronum thiosulfatophilum TaxID=617002 RepID=A0A1G6C937_9BACT|nr:flagellar basal body rod C-terminal domain-containing protein [Desulfonatronum thiosulfatophilum]SDB29366.1 flagellar basal-body rod protein FlgC [Desulfonatronum thiosulfatophilum]
MNISPNIQALHAIGLSRQVGANNVANMNTPDFKASRLSLETGPEGLGVRPQAIDQDPTPGPLVPALEGATDEDGHHATVWGLAEGSNTELVAEMVNSIRDERAFQANVAMVRTWDELTGTVLDMRA